VIRHIREKLSCRACDTVVAAPAPDHAIARRRAGAGLLAHIVVSKYDDHLPLYRQGGARRIGQLYRVEEAINGTTPEHRRRERQQHSRPVAEALRSWGEEILRKLSRKIGTGRRLPLHAGALGRARPLLR
jgi:transposase